ncbi:hypothetical protein [Mesorhizobium sp. M0058]|uniref:hypothetical protein n=1 Tax=Mesorhizobium sp. M0058 TaxID=2956865 RepID=UPI003335ADAF
MPGAEPFLAAFWDLSTDRYRYTGPVPGWAIRSWAAELGLDDPDELASFRGAMRAMDRVYLERANRDPGAPGKPAPVVSSRPLSPNLFDAMFGPK